MAPKRAAALPLAAPKSKALRAGPLPAIDLETSYRPGVLRPSPQKPIVIREDIEYTFSFLHLPPSRKPLRQSDSKSISDSESSPPSPLPQPPPEAKRTTVSPQSRPPIFTVSGGAESGAGGEPLDEGYTQAPDGASEPSDVDTELHWIPEGHP